VPKIISECCELVKLCHINCSGPVSLRHCIHGEASDTLALNGIANNFAQYFSHIYTPNSSKRAAALRE